MSKRQFPIASTGNAGSRSEMNPRALLHELCLPNPQPTLRLLGHFCDRPHGVINQVDWLTSRSVAERLAARLEIRSETLSRLLSHWRAPTAN